MVESLRSQGLLRPSNIALRLIVVAIVAASVLLPVGSRLLPCFYQTVFDFGCLGCGVTRSFLLIGKGEFQQAWHMNPLGMLLYPGVICYAFWSLPSLLKKGQRLIHSAANR